MRNALLITIISLGLSLSASAEETLSAKTFTSEDELSTISTSGNTQTKTYNAKSLNTYNWHTNSLGLSGAYTFAETNGNKNVEKWNLGLRYEKSLSKSFGLFVAHLLESNYFAGFTKRRNSDFGAKYFFSKSDTSTTFSEVGLRHVDEEKLVGKNISSSKGRLYIETAQEVSSTTQLKFWFEYIPNFTDGRDYLVNYEPSLSVSMSKVLSLKLAMLVNYYNLPTQLKRHDSTYTTSIIAKF